MKQLLIFAVVATCLAGCDRRSDQEKLQGEWELQTMWGWFTFDLSPSSKDDREVLTFDGNTFGFKNPRSNRRVSGTFVCDPAKNPKEITFTYGDRSVAAIYSFSEDTLSICVGENDTVAPTELKGGPRARPALLHFRHPGDK